MPRLCSGGCLRVVPDGVRFCDECKPTRVTDGDAIREHRPAEVDEIREHVSLDSDRARYAALYGGQRFRRLSKGILRRDAMCKRCDEALSEIADHIVPAGEAIRQARESGRWPFDANAGFFLASNLQGLCRRCHGIKTREDAQHAGEWPDVIAGFDAMPKKTWHF